MERDVVCGMQVDPAKAVWTSQFEGRTYYFCGKGCKAKFDAEPARYLRPGLGTRDSGLDLGIWGLGFGIWGLTRALATNPRTSNPESTYIVTS